MRLDRGVIGKEAAAEALREWAREKRNRLLSAISDLDREHVWHPYAPVPRRRRCTWSPGPTAYG